MLVTACTSSALLIANGAQEARTLDQAIELLEQGLERPGEGDLRTADPRIYYETALHLHRMAVIDPDSLEEVKGLLVAELRRLRQWEYFPTEVHGAYLIALAKTLFEMKDPATLDTLMAMRRYGHFAAEGLASFGAVAVVPIVEEIADVSRGDDPVYGGVPVLINALTMIAARISPDTGRGAAEALLTYLEGDALPVVLEYVGVYADRVPARHPFLDEATHARDVEGQREWVRALQGALDDARRRLDGS